MSYNTLPDSREFRLSINRYMQKAYATSKNHGWWEDDDETYDPVAIAFMHGELSEALKIMRRDQRMPDKDIKNVTALAVELANVVIRIFDFCYARNHDLANAIIEKMEANNYPVR